jgi:predicted nucleotidyltransferase
MRDAEQKQLDRVVALVSDVLGPEAVGAYLFGSAVLGGLRPRSDLDVLVVSRRGTTREQKQRLVASQEQAEALGAVFSGQKGGPMEALSPLIGEQLGLETAAIEYSNGGTRHYVKAGDLVEMEVEDVVPEGMTEPTRLVGVAHPANTTLTVAHGKRSRVNVFGLDFSNTGKNGYAAPFSWAA